MYSQHKAQVDVYICKWLRVDEMADNCISDIWLVEYQLEIILNLF